MNEATKKLSEEWKKNLDTALMTPAWKSFIESTKSAGDASGTFEVCISDDQADRQGESLDQKGLDTANYELNPVVLWAHDYYSLPIGVCTSIEKQGGKTIAKGRFAPMEANPFAQQVRALYDAGIIRATSVGFIVKEMQGKTITKSELLEFSFVPVPANPRALTLTEAKELGIDLGMLALKGLGMLEKKEETVVAAKAEGDVCQLPDDGGEGVIDAEGNCVPKKTEAAAAAPEQKGAVADELDAEAAWEQKWQNLDKVCDIFNAFFDVYLSQETPVDQFNVLLAECVSLLAGVAGTTTEEAKAMIKTVMEAKTAKAFITKQAIKQIGAGTAGGAGTEGEATLDGAPQKQVDAERSHGKEDLAAFGEFRDARAVIREIVAAGTEALERYNKRGKTLS